MKLETENIKDVEATVELIRELMSDDLRRSGFLIMSHDDDDAKFVQITYDENTNAFALEYRDGNDKPLYRCNRPVSRTEAEKALFDYIEELESWKGCFDWKIDNDYETKGCLGGMSQLRPVLGFIAIFCILGIGAIYLKTEKLSINMVKLAIFSLVSFYVLRFMSKR